MCGGLTTFKNSIYDKYQPFQVTVIKHFLGDIEKSSTYNGFCRLGIKWQPIESEHMRNYFQLSAEQTGVLVTKVLPLFSCSSVLKRGDVLMAVDEEVIADNGTVS